MATATPPTSQAEGGSQTTTRVLVVAAVLALPALSGILVFVLLIVGAVFAMNAQQNACGASLYGDGTVPLPAEDPAAPLTVKVASWNTLYSNSTSRVIGGVKQLDAAGADVIGFQELGPSSRRQSLRKAVGDTWAFSAGNNAALIGWRKDRYDLLAQGNLLEFGVKRIEGGASGTSIGPKHLQWVELRDRRTRAVFFEVNHHIVPTIESGGHPNGKSKRLALYRQQMKVMLSTVDKLAKTAPVFATGDFNIAAKADARVQSPTFPYVQGAKHGLYSNWRTLGYPKGGTHAGGRHIDYVWATTDQAAPIAQQILGRYGSDHHAVLVTLSNARAVSRLRQDSQGNLSLTRQTITKPPPTTGSYDETRRQQIANARLVERGVRAAGGSGRAVYVALVAAVGESDLINVAYGDKAGPDSRGLFQQRAPWGSLAQRMNPVWAAGAFMLGPHQGHSGGLLQLAGWEQLPVTTAIHRVQINADPNHYTKFEARAREIGQQAGVDFDAPAGSAADTADTAATDASCTSDAADQIGLAGIGTGPCPLDQLHAAPGKANPRDCNGALTFMTKQMTSGSHAWKRQCMALVAIAYGWHYSGNDTAYIGAQRVIAAGKMSTDRTNIPKGAVMWWDGRRTGNTAGHVAIYDGNGHILSNDVPVNDGRVGRVPWTYPETNWGQKWLGWSPPYLPNAG